MFPAHLFAIRVRLHERRNELIPVWDFEPVWKQVLFTWSFIPAAFQNKSIFRWTCVGISFRLVITWYFINRNKTSFLSKLVIWNPCPHWVLNALNALNATFNQSALIHFVSGKLCSHENLMLVWNFISVKMTDMKSILFWVWFRLNSCEHN